MSQNHYKVLRTFPNEVEAQVASNFLQTHGIDCQIKSDNVAGLHPELSLTSGVNLAVDKQLFDRAEKLLNNPQPAEYEPSHTSAHNDTKQKSNSGSFFSVKSALIGLLIGVCAGYYSYAVVNSNTDLLDINEDGKVDNHYEFVGDFLKSSRHDINFDGKFDSYLEYTSSHSGESRSDTNFDGIIDQWSTFEYDLDKELRTDLDGNGVPDIFYIYENSALKRAELRPNGSNVVERKEVYSSDFSFVEWIDKDKDGSFDLSNHFDTFGYLVKTENY